MKSETKLIRMYSFVENGNDIQLTLKTSTFKGSPTNKIYELKLLDYDNEELCKGMDYTYSGAVNAMFLAGKKLGFWNER